MPAGTPFFRQSCMWCEAVRACSACLPTKARKHCFRFVDLVLRRTAVYVYLIGFTVVCHLRTSRKAEGVLYVQQCRDLLLRVQ